MFSLKPAKQPTFYNSATTSKSDLHNLVDKMFLTKSLLQLPQLECTELHKKIIFQQPWSILKCLCVITLLWWAICCCCELQHMYGVFISLTIYRYIFQYLSPMITKLTLLWGNFQLRIKVNFNVSVSLDRVYLCKLLQSRSNLSSVYSRCFTFFEYPIIYWPWLRRRKLLMGLFSPNKAKRVVSLGGANLKDHFKR